MESFGINIQSLAIQFVPFLMAVIFHEFAHGWAALKFGDPTARDNGRLTLNPLPHMDMFGTLLFPIMGMLTGTSFLFGWAKPVPINPTRFKKYRPGLFWVSFAGPLMNFILANVCAAVLCLMIKYAPRDFYLFEPILGMLKVGITLNFALGFFNLLPLPPLDGSKMIQSFLNYNATKAYESIAPYSFFILMGLMMTGILSVLSYPIQICSNMSLYVMASIFNLGGMGI
jgi:Zn-dependent protease